jgi:DNA invertase Pin-like site-specific DNA recombinase
MTRGPVFSREDVVEMKALYKRGKTMKQLARERSVDRKTVSLAIQNKGAYRDIDSGEPVVPTYKGSGANSALTPMIVRKIKASYLNNPSVSVKRLACQFNISTGTIYNVLRNKVTYTDASVYGEPVN